MLATHEHRRVGVMERHQYTIPADKVAQHIRRIVPRQAIVHYWYEIPEPSIQTPLKTIPENEVKNPQLRAFLNGIASFGGLTNNDVEAIKTYSKQFRDNNPLS